MRRQILNKLLEIFSDLKTYRPQFHSSTITLQKDGKWSGISIQELESLCSDHDLTWLDAGYEALTQWSSDASDAVRATPHAGRLENGIDYKITARLSPRNFREEYKLNDTLVSSMNYRQRLMLNDIIFDITQPLIAGSKDPNKKRRIVSYICKVLNQCLDYDSENGIGFKNAGDFSVPQTTLDVLEAKVKRYNNRYHLGPRSKSTPSAEGIIQPRPGLFKRAATSVKKKRMQRADAVLDQTDGNKLGI